MKNPFGLILFLIGSCALSACGDTLRTEITLGTKPPTPEKPLGKLEVEKLNSNFHSHLALLATLELYQLNNRLVHGDPLPNCVQVKQVANGHQHLSYDVSRCSFGEGRNQVRIGGVEDLKWAINTQGQLTQLNLKSESQKILFRNSKGRSTFLIWSRTLELEPPDTAGAQRWSWTIKIETETETLNRDRKMLRQWLLTGEAQVAISGQQVQKDFSLLSLGTQGDYLRVIQEGIRQDTRAASVRVGGEQPLSVGFCGQPLGNLQLNYQADELGKPLDGVIESSESSLANSISATTTTWSTCLSTTVPLVRNLIKFVALMDPERKSDAIK